MLDNMKNLKTHIALPVLACLLMLASACSDFLDINDDPNFSADATNIQLLPAAQAGYAIGMSAMLERAAATMVQHYINPRFDNYGFDGSSYDNDWSFLYGSSLQDFEQIIKQSQAGGDRHYAGVAKIQKAYIYSVLVDLFGNVPYSDALQGAGNFNPPAEAGASVYPKLIALIDEGLADLDAESSIELGSADLIYGGNLANWRRMANTLKLKLHNQTRLVDPNASRAAIDQLLTAGNLISSSAQNFTFRFTNSNAPEGRHPNFQSDWAAGSLENNLARFIVNRMTTANDPRLRYYFYRQQANAGLVGVNGGESSSAGDDNVRAIFGIYPVGGAFDDASFRVHNQDAGLKGAGIFPMITNTNCLFIQAEAALMLGTAGDPRVLLAAALASSFAEVAALAGVPMIAADVTTYTDNVLARYDAATTNEERLRVIMDEKYIAMYGNGIESYNDYRRTGYPAGLLAPVVAGGPYPNRFPIPPVEYNTNSSIAPTTDLTAKVFWDLN